MSFKKDEIALRKDADLSHPSAKSRLGKLELYHHHHDCRAITSLDGEWAKFATAVTPLTSMGEGQQEIRPRH